MQTEYGVRARVRLRVRLAVKLSRAARTRITWINFYGRTAMPR